MHRWFDAQLAQKILASTYMRGICRNVIFLHYHYSVNLASLITKVALRSSSQAGSLEINQHIFFDILQEAEEPEFQLSFTASPTTTASSAMQDIAQVGGALGAGMIGMVMMMPSMNSQGSSNPSGGSSSAGTPGGGGLPTDAGISTLALSLALVPFGLSAVAVFPPFARYVK